MPGAEMERVFVCSRRGVSVPAGAQPLFPEEEKETDGSVTIAVPIRSATIPRPMPMDQDVPFFEGPRSSTVPGETRPVIWDIPSP